MVWGVDMAVYVHAVSELGLDPSWSSEISQFLYFLFKSRLDCELNAEMLNFKLNFF